MEEKRYHNPAGSYECKYCKEKFRLKLSLILHEQKCTQRNNYYGGKK